MSVASIRAQLERHGLRLHRGLGQNFLIESAQADRLVRLAGVEEGDRVIEIGTGLGALTCALARRGARVVTLEIDSGLVRALREEAILPEGVELIHADARKVDLAALLRREPGPTRVVANLPYSAATPLLRGLLDERECLEDWSVTLQREVALRLLAPVGSSRYGSFTVLHQLTTTPRNQAQLKPSSFFPLPKVDSTFVRLVPLRAADAPRLAEGELEAVERVARAAFSQRRKKLLNALTGASGFERDACSQALERAGIDPGARAQNIAASGYLALARALRESPQPAPSGEEESCGTPSS